MVSTIVVKRDTALRSPTLRAAVSEAGDFRVGDHLRHLIIQLLEVLETRKSSERSHADWIPSILARSLKPGRGEERLPVTVTDGDSVTVSVTVVCEMVTGVATVVALGRTPMQEQALA